MDLDKIQAIMNQFEESSIRELNIDEGEFHLYLSKNKAANKKSQVPIVEKTKVEVPAKTPVQENKADDANLTPVTAPLVGVVYLQSKPGEPAYVKPGDHIQKGDTVCIIEAMKMMTEVKSKISGTVVEVKVENEDLVEVDQPLVMVRED